MIEKNIKQYKEKNSISLNKLHMNGFQDGDTIEIVPIRHSSSYVIPGGKLLFCKDEDGYIASAISGKNWVNELRY